MRHPLPRAIALAAPLALGAPLAEAAAQPWGGVRAPVVAELTALYQRFLDANRVHDTTRARELLTPDYVYVGGDSGRVLDRAERMRRDAPLDGGAPAGGARGHALSAPTVAGAGVRRT